MTRGPRAAACSAGMCPTSVRTSTWAARSAVHRIFVDSFRIPRSANEIGSARKELPTTIARLRTYNVLDRTIGRRQSEYFELIRSILRELDSEDASGWRSSVGLLVGAVRGVGVSTYFPSMSMKYRPMGARSTNRAPQNVIPVGDRVLSRLNALPILYEIAIRAAPRERSPQTCIFGATRSSWGKRRGGHRISTSYQKAPELHDQIERPVGQADRSRLPITSKYLDPRRRTELAAETRRGRTRLRIDWRRDRDGTGGNDE